VDLAGSFGWWQVTILFINLPEFQYDTQEQALRNQAAFLEIQKVLTHFDGNLR